MFSPTYPSDEISKSSSQESTLKVSTGDIFKIGLQVNLFVTFKNNVSTGSRDILSFDINNVDMNFFLTITYYI